MAAQKIRSKKHKRRKRQQRRRQIIATVVGLLLLVAGLVGLTHWSGVQIQSFTVTAPDSLPGDQIRQLVSAQLDRNTWLIISSNNILLIPRSDIQERIRNLSTRIRSVDVDLAGLRSFDVDVKLRQPTARFCSLAEDVDDCHVVDAGGLVFAKSNNVGSASSSKELSVTFVASSSLQVGQQLLEERMFEVLYSFLESLPEVGFEPMRVRLQDYRDVVITTRQPQATSTTATTTVDIKTNLKNNLNQTLTDLQTVVEKDAFVGATSTEGDVEPESVSPFSLEYIDLRFGNKVFYQ